MTTFPDLQTPAATPTELPTFSITAVFARLADRIRASEARARERRTYEHLMKVDDHILKDIGLTEAELRHAWHRAGGR